MVPQASAYIYEKLKVGWQQSLISFRALSCRTRFTSATMAPSATPPMWECYDAPRPAHHRKAQWRFMSLMTAEDATQGYNHALVMAWRETSCRSAFLLHRFTTAALSHTTIFYSFECGAWQEIGEGPREVFLQLHGHKSASMQSIRPS